MENIDFIITWVNGSDPEWQAEKAKYQEEKNGDNRVVRYRDWDNLQYWFRGVETYAPWVNKIFFITWGHVPSWLNRNHPKLVVVNHKDYIPSEYLPTFSSRAIDMNFHRIPELSEHFVYFNDDMFLTAKVEPKDFFKRGLPCDTAVLNAIYFGHSGRTTGEKIPSNVTYTAPAFDMIPINRNFDKNQTIFKNWNKWFTPVYGLAWIRTLLLLPWQAFTGMMGYHLPYSYLKSTYEEVWEKEPDLLSQTCKHRFRQITDLNHWVFSYWQLAKGTFMPRNPKVGMAAWLNSNQNKNQEIFSAIRTNKYKFVCVNDGVTGDNFEEVKRSLNECLDYILPNKSKFEK